MKKNFVKRIGLLLALVTCFSAFGCDCAKNDDPTETLDKGVYLEKNVTDANHSTLVKDTDNYLFVNGNTDYKIVVPALLEKDKYVTEAVEELNYFFSLAVGATIPVQTDTGLVYSDEAKYISLGNTALLQQTGYTVEKISSNDGYEIISKGNSTFIVGGGTSGILYGIYKFLYHEIGFEAFAQDEIVYTQSQNVKLYEYDVREIPDFDIRHNAIAEYHRNAEGLEFAHRAGCNGYSDYMLAIDGALAHTSLELVPPELYYDEHPEWFESGKIQLCYTRDVEGLTKVIVDRVKVELIKDTSAKIVNISHEDGQVWCACDSCTQSKNKYGAHSAAMLKLINECAKELNRWLSAPANDEAGSYTDAYMEAYGYAGPTDREVYVMMFAYTSTLAPPNVDKVDFELESNVAVQWAPISANWTYALNHQKNVSFASTIESWGKIVDCIMFWGYSLHELDQFSPVASMNAIQETYKYMKSMKTVYVFQESSHPLFKMVDWSALKGYLISKLMWNVNADVPALTEKFMTNYYGEAAEEMTKFYYDTQDYLLYLADVLGRSGYNPSITTEHWPQAVTLKYMDMAQEAILALSSVKESNPMRAEKLEKRIVIEGLPYQYLLLKNYKNFYTESQFAQMKEAFIADINYTGAMQGAYSDWDKHVNSLIDAL